MIRTTILGLGALALASCASIVSDSTYPVTFSSDPPGAELAIRDGDGKSLYRGNAPVTLSLEAGDGFFGRARYEVEATLAAHDPGTATVRASLDGWYIGNLLFGGLIGFFIVDPATGAMWKLPSTVVVPLGGS